MHAKPNRDTVPQVINGRINGKFAPGYSGNPGGSPEATRRAFNKRFLLDLAEDWQQHGREVFEQGRRKSPACVLEGLRVAGASRDEGRASGGVKAMTDEQLEAGIEAIQTMLAARDAGANAKVIEAVEELPSPGELEGPKPRRTLSRKAWRDVGSGRGHSAGRGD